MSTRQHLFSTPRFTDNRTATHRKEIKRNRRGLYAAAAFASLSTVMMSGARAGADLPIPIPSDPLGDALPRVGAALDSVSPPGIDVQGIAQGAIDAAVPDQDSPVRNTLESLADSLRPAPDGWQGGGLPIQQAAAPIAGGDAAQRANPVGDLAAVAAQIGNSPMSLGRLADWADHTFPSGPLRGPVDDLLEFVGAATEQAGSRRRDQGLAIDDLIEQARVAFGFPKNGANPAAALRDLVHGVAAPADPLHEFTGQLRTLVDHRAPELAPVAAAMLGFTAPALAGLAPLLGFVTPVLGLLDDPTRLLHGIRALLGDGRLIGTRNVFLLVGGFAFGFVGIGVVPLLFAGALAIGALGIFGLPLLVLLVPLVLGGLILAALALPVLIIGALIAAPFILGALVIGGIVLAALALPALLIGGVVLGVLGLPLLLAGLALVALALCPLCWALLLGGPLVLAVLALCPLAWPLVAVGAVALGALLVVKAIEAVVGLGALAVGAVLLAPIVLGALIIGGLVLAALALPLLIIGGLILGAIILGAIVLGAIVLGALFLGALVIGGLVLGALALVALPLLVLGALALIAVGLPLIGFGAVVLAVFLLCPLTWIVAALAVPVLVIGLFLLLCPLTWPLFAIGAVIVGAVLLFKLAVLGVGLGALGLGILLTGAGVLTLLGLVAAVFALPVLGVLALAAAVLAPLVLGGLGLAALIGIPILLGALAIAAKLAFDAVVLGGLVLGALVLGGLVLTAVIGIPLLLGALAIAAKIAFDAVLLSALLFGAAALAGLAALAVAFVLGALASAAVVAPVAFLLGALVTALIGGPILAALSIAGTTAVVGPLAFLAGLATGAGLAGLIAAVAAAIGVEEALRQSRQFRSYLISLARTVLDFFGPRAGQSSGVAPNGSQFLDDLPTDDADLDKVIASLTKLLAPQPKRSVAPARPAAHGTVPFVGTAAADGSIHGTNTRRVLELALVGADGAEERRQSW
ncbi:hypothetical protein [Nocardia sp. NPDC051570]|uniref:hypothetical protein n=1 Tax=Nocardia sp. NPDC051570 TaxID=3364324 RepID=UPI0037963B0D